MRWVTCTMAGGIKSTFLLLKWILVEWLPTVVPADVSDDDLMDLVVYRRRSLALLLTHPIRLSFLCRGIGG